MTDRSELFGRKIENLNAAKRWIVDLYSLNLMFHFEDNTREVGNTVDGRWVNTFKPSEAMRINKRIGELYSFDWSDCGGCPIGYALAVMASPKVRVEFPDYDIATLPGSLSSFEDVSWHNDACPSFKATGTDLLLFVDYAKPEDREHPDAPRFSLHYLDGDGCLIAAEPVLVTDDFDAIDAAVQIAVYAKKSATK